VLADPKLVGQWTDELDTMRARMRQVRDRLAAAGKVGSLDLTPVGTQNGLFSMLALAPEQIMRLRQEHGIYMAGSGRINIAGLTGANIDNFIAALRAVTG
jgi:aromatic-amino-acid transaminase